jgi:twinkle protein
MAGVISEDDIDFGQYMQATDPRAKMRPASAYRGLVKQRFAVGVKHVGTAMPWGKTEDKIRFREGEVTVWAGENGSGKSLVNGQAVMGFMRSQRCAIASFEMRPETTLQRMCRQASQGANPTDQFIDSFHDWTDNRLWLYDHQGQIDPEHMLAVCRFAHQELQIKHLVIDSLMKVIRDEDDMNGQKRFVNDVCAIALNTGMHIHLVHHMRKNDGNGRPGSKSDIKGSGSITDQVDNVIIVWRNKAKEAASQANKEVDQDSPDALMIVDKQRNGEWEGRIGLWFDKDSQQYLGSSSDGPAEFVGRQLRAVA